MNYRCDGCSDEIIQGAFAMVTVQHSGETPGDLHYHPHCAIKDLAAIPADECCEACWLDSK